MNKLLNQSIQRFWPFIGIVGLWFLFSSPYFLKGLIPFPSTYLVSFFPPWSASYAMPVKNNAMPDIITQIYPWKKFTIDTLKSGQLPLWNPYSFSGTKHAANYQTEIYSPFNILFLILPFIDAWSLLVLLQPLLAGLYMVLFLRETRASPSAQIIGGIAFMFSGFIVTWMAYGTLGYAVLFLPLLLWSINRFIRNGSLFAYCVGALSLAASFFSGHFQISLYVLGVSFLFIIYESYIGHAFKRGMLLIFMMIIGLGISAPQLFISYEAFQSSVRSGYTNIQEVIPWKYVVTFFSPDFFGNPVTRNDWFGHYAEWAGYVGIIPLLLSLYGFLILKNSKIFFFIALFFISLLLAYASPFSSALFLWKIPVLSTSAASRIIVICSFSLSVLSALGFDQLTDDWNNHLWKKWGWFMVFSAILLCVVWGVVFLFRPFSPEHLIIAKRNLILPTALTVIALLLIAVGFLKKWKDRKFVTIVLILLCCFDSYRFAAKWMPFDPKEFIYPMTKTITELQKQISTDRIFGNIGNELGSTFHIPLIEGYDALYQARYGEFINAASNGIVSDPGRSVVQFDKHGRFAIQTLQLLGVRYIIHRFSDGRNVWAFPYWQYQTNTFRSIYKDEHYELFEYKDVFPRSFLVSSYIVKNDKQEIIDALFDKDLDRRNTVILEEHPQINPEAGTGSSEITFYSPTHIVVKTSSLFPKILFLSDVFDSGWTATVDGKVTKIMRADYDFRAIALDKGEHIVEYHYRPQSVTYGFLTLIVGSILLIGVVGFGVVTRKHV